jgi:hypothetical protein
MKGDGLMAMSKKRSSNERAARGRWGVKALLALALPLVAAGVFLLRSAPTVPAGSGAATKGAVVRRETRPTLSPARFVGKAAQAHQIAQEIPEILDQLYCYCECDKHQGHKSLLSCFTDGHAPT